MSDHIYLNAIFTALYFGTSHQMSMAGLDMTPELNVAIFDKLMNRHPDVITNTPSRVAAKHHPSSDSATPALIAKEYQSLCLSLLPMSMKHMGMVTKDYRRSKFAFIVVKRRCPERTQSSKHCADFHRRIYCLRQRKSSGLHAPGTNDALTVWELPETHAKNFKPSHCVIPSHSCFHSSEC